MKGALNLSSAPFVNRRPVVRLGIVLWIVGGLLLAGNVWLYWDFLAGKGEAAAGLREAHKEIAVEQRRIEALGEELAATDLAAQNAQVEYLNQRIDRRRFSWSRLLNDLAAILPRDVRLQGLTPATGEGGGRTSRRQESALAGGEVLLQIDAEARNDEAILEMIDALFADPAFEDPNLLQQREGENGVIGFDVEVLYRPPSAREDTPLAAEELDATADREPADAEGDGGEAALAPAAAGGPRT